MKLTEEQVNDIKFRESYRKNNPYERNTVAYETYNSLLEATCYHYQSLKSAERWGKKVEDMEKVLSFFPVEKKKKVKKAR